MSKQNDSGFTVVEALLILLVVGILGLMGWLVWKSQHKSSNARANSNSQVSQDQRTSKTSYITISAGPTPGTLTYMNKTVGFTFNFPETAEGSSGCIDKSTVFDNFGNPISSPSHKQVSEGVVKSTVLNSGSNFYIASEKAYVTGDYVDTTVNGQQYPLAHSCESVSTSPQLIEKYEAQQDVKPSFASISHIKFMLLKINKQAVESEVQKIFSDPTLKVTRFTDSAQGNWQDLTFDCAKTPCAYTGGHDEIRYYANQRMLFYWGAGNGCNLASNSSSANVACEDQGIISSLKLLD